MNNVEALAKLRLAADKSGRTYLDREVFISDKPSDAPVARGFEKMKDTIITHNGVRIAGVLAVRGLVALESVNDPFNYKGEGTPEYLIRTRLAFAIPDGLDAQLGIEAGSHTVSTAYLLSSQNPGDIDADRRQVLSAIYHHSVPVIGERRFTDDDLDDPRTVLVTQWIAEGAHKEGMPMLSPTSEGSVSRTELPSTIQWLLTTDSPVQEKPMKRQTQMHQSKSQQHGNK